MTHFQIDCVFIWEFLNLHVKNNRVRCKILYRKSPSLWKTIMLKILTEENNRNKSWIGCIGRQRIVGTSFTFLCLHAKKNTSACYHLFWSTRMQRKLKLSCVFMNWVKKNLMKKVLFSMRYFNSFLVWRRLIRQYWVLTVFILKVFFFKVDLCVRLHILIY